MSQSKSQVKKLSCQSCRIKRRKCDQQEPCGTCVKLGIGCVPVHVDRRKNRVNDKHLRVLEDYVAHLESLLISIKSEVDTDVRQEIIESISLENVIVSGSSVHVPSSKINSPHREPKSPNFSPNISELPNLRKSAYPSDSLSISSSKDVVAKEGAELRLPSDSYNFLSRSPFILSSLSLFFKWAYPSLYFFVYREAFLSAFFQDNLIKSTYCSKELVYAIAALGARLERKSEDLYSKSLEYYYLAKDAVLKKAYLDGKQSEEKVSSSSKLVFIQTLLCLAFYDIGRGENVSAWYLSGLAFRIVHEIGLHLNPCGFTYSNSENSISQIDIEVKARIYWGCYLADHFIAELFGRTTILRLSNSTVPETDELPDIKSGYEDYMYADPNEPLLVACPVKKLIFLSRMCELYAKKLFHQSRSSSEKIESLCTFNGELQYWRSALPKELAWTKETLTLKKYTDPTISYLWYHYYMIVLSYNKAFISDCEQSATLVEESIQDLYYLLRNWKRKFRTFEKCCIQMVYTAILALQCMKIKRINNTHYSHFISFLRSPTLNYDLVEGILENEDPTEALYTFDLSDGFRFLTDENPDLSLLKEIDALVGRQKPT